MLNEPLADTDDVLTARTPEVQRATPYGASAAPRSAKEAQAAPTTSAPAPGPNPGRPEVSVIIPTYNEEDNIVQIVEAVIERVAPLVRDYEILIIDNASVDRTVDLIRDLCVKYPFIRCIVNTRNFGQMRSPAHGIFQCRGDAIIGISADFQDPPDLLPEFIHRWRQGWKIVLAARQAEPAGRMLTAMRELSYKVLGTLGEVKTITGATGFGLYDKQVIDTLRSWNDPEPFFRAMLVESGYPLSVIHYERPPRQRGQSKNNWRTLSSFAMSALPLISRNVFRIGFGVSIGFVVTGVLVMLASLPLLLLSWKALVAAAIAGFATAVVGCLGGLMSMLGLQVMTVSDRLRRVPLVIEGERINFGPSADS